VKLGSARFLPKHGSASETRRTVATPLSHKQPTSQAWGGSQEEKSLWGKIPGRRFAEEHQPAHSGRFEWDFSPAISSGKTATVSHDPFRIDLEGYFMPNE